LRYHIALEQARYIIDHDSPSFSYKNVNL
jgi:hypothetical protein